MNIIVQRQVFDFETENIVKGPCPKPVLAAGVLFHKIVDGDVQVLVVRYFDPNWPNLDDLGGRANIFDRHVFDTIVREVREETNGIIEITLAMSQIAKKVYVPESKYACWLIDADSQEANGVANLECADFGVLERDDDIFRLVNWFKIPKDEELIKKFFAVRLHKPLLELIGA